MYNSIFYQSLCIHSSVVSHIVYQKLIFAFLPLSTNLLCVSQPYCSLHLHLHMSENPYTSGNIVSKDSAPGIIIASGERIIWFTHPYCCLLSPSIICPQHCQSFSSLVVFPAQIKEWLSSWQQFEKWNEMNHACTSVTLPQLYRCNYCLFTVCNMLEIIDCTTLPFVSRCGWTRIDQY